MVRSIPGISAPFWIDSVSADGPRGSICAIRAICVIRDPRLSRHEGQLGASQGEPRDHNELALPRLEDLRDPMIRARKMQLRLAIGGLDDGAPNLGLQRYQLSTELRFSVF